MSAFVRLTLFSSLLSSFVGEYATAFSGGRKNAFTIRNYKILEGLRGRKCNSPSDFARASRATKAARAPKISQRGYADVRRSAPRPRSAGSPRSRGHPGSARRPHFRQYGRARL